MRSLEQCEVAFERRLGQTDVARERGDVQQAPSLSGQQGQEAGHLCEAVDIRHVPHVTLQDRGDVGPEPGLAAGGICAVGHLGVPAGNDPLSEVRTRHCQGRNRRQGTRAEQGVNEALAGALQFTLRERPERQDLHTSGQGFGEFGQQQDIGRPGQQETPRRSLAIHFKFEGPKELGGQLDLIDDHRRGKAGQESAGVAGGG